jgi:putative transcriptional regulator
MSIVRRTPAEVDLSKIDWATLDATTDPEIAADSDTAPIFTADDLARARRVIPAPAPDDVKGIRQRLGLSQQQFAARFGFSVETIRNYEQGHRTPTGPASVLLRVIASNPDAVIRALAR